MSLLIINGNQLPEPTEYQVVKADLDKDDKRNDNGFLIRRTIRRDITTISVKWTMLTQEELTSITSSLSQQMTISFFDGQYGGYSTTTMYASDRDMSMRARPNDKPYWDLSLSLVEY